MGDDECRREDARQEAAAIDRALRNGTMGVCACGDVTSQKGEDPDTGEEYWVCWICSEEPDEED